MPLGTQLLYSPQSCGQTTRKNFTATSSRELHVWELMGNTTKIFKFASRYARNRVLDRTGTMSLVSRPRTEHFWTPERSKCPRQPRASQPPG